MILGSPSFEKSMREKLRTLGKNSPEFRKERRKASRLAGRTRSPVTNRIVALLVTLALLGTYSSTEGGLLAGIVALSFWAIGSAFKIGSGCLSMFYASMDLFVLHQLPLNHAQIFRIQGRKFLAQASWALLDFALAYLVITLILKSDFLSITAASAIGLFQGALTVALGIHLACRFTHFPLNAIAGFLRTAAFFFLFFGRGFQQYLPDVATIVDLSNPSGWVNYTFRHVALSNEWWMLVLLLPVAMIIWTARFSWRRLQIAYNSLDEMELEFQQEQSEIESQEAMLGELQPQTRKKGITELTDEIQSGNFREGARWEGIGWIEKLVANFLNRRERIIADILLGGVPKWSRIFHRTAVTLAICALLLTLFRPNGEIILFIAGYILVTSTYSLFAREWRGLEAIRAPGGFVPFYAFYPISFADIVRILWKANFLRWIVAGPFYIAAGLFGGWALGSTPELGLVLAMKIYLLLLVAQPLILFCTLSAGTNDTSKGTIGSAVLLLFIIIPLFLAIIGLVFFLFLAVDRMTAGACLLGIFSISIFFLVLQWAGYRKGWFDLISNQSRPQEK